MTKRFHWEPRRTQAPQVLKERAGGESEKLSKTPFQKSLKA